MRKWLLVVLALALTLRVVGLSELPFGFTPDEASFGYDAWSLLKTGKDQWGNRWPMMLKSFGDYKAPLYAYLVMPFVGLLGLSEWAVRLPNALLSVGAVAMVYLLLREWWEDERVALLAALLLAVSPWHVMLSRGGFEANLTVFFLPFSIWALAKGRKKPMWMYVSIVAMGLNLFSYHSAKLITLPIWLGFAFWWRRDLAKWGRQVKIGAVILGAILVAMLGQQLAGGGARAADVSILNPDDRWSYVADQRFRAVNGGVPDLVARLFWNKARWVGELFFRNYISYFSPEFLFTKGPGEATYGMVPGIGLLYPIELVGLVGFGLYLVRGGEKKGAWLLLLWLAVAAIPAALTKGPGWAANRVAGMMPAWQIMSAVGGVFLIDKLRERNPRRWMWVGGVILVIFGLGWIENYVYQAPYETAASMLYGRGVAMESIKKDVLKYDKVVVSRSLSEPQIFVAFYLGISPKDFQEASREWRMEEYGVKFLDQVPVYDLGKYEFRKIDWQEDRHLARTLFVGPPEEVPGGGVNTREVFYPNGRVAVRIAEGEERAWAVR